MYDDNDQLIYAFRTNRHTSVLMRNSKKCICPGGQCGVVAKQCRRSGFDSRYWQEIKWKLVPATIQGRLRERVYQ